MRAHLMLQQEITYIVDTGEGHRNGGLKSAS